MTSAALNTAAAITTGRAPDAQIDEMFHERWSRRALSSRPLSPEQVRSLFEAARWAPSSSNQQPWLFVYNDDAETLARARPVLMEFNRRWADNAPLLIFVFARKRHPDTGEPLRSAQFDTGAAWFSIALQAHKLGLNTRAMGGIQHELAYDTFGVPREDFESIAAIAVGYPGERAELHASLIEREVPTTRRPASTFALKGQYRRE